MEKSYPWRENFSSTVRKDVSRIELDSIFVYPKEGNTQWAYWKMKWKMLHADARSRLKIRVMLSSSAMPGKLKNLFKRLTMIEMLRTSESQSLSFDLRVSDLWVRDTACHETLDCCGKTQESRSFFKIVRFTGLPI